MCGENPNPKKTKAKKLSDEMVDEGWTTVEKKGPKEAGNKGGGVRQERAANGGGSRGSGAHRNT